MYHVNKSFFGKNKLFYIILFLFFISIIFITKYHKEPKKQIEHETNVQYDTKDVNIFKKSETVQ